MQTPQVDFLRRDGQLVAAPGTGFTGYKTKPPQLKENIIQENDGMGQVMESEKKTAFKTEIVERTGSVSFNPFMTAPPSKDEIVNDEDSEMNEEPGGNANYPDHCTC